VHYLFFRLGGGRPLHKVHFLIFRNPLGVPTICFAILPLKISYNFLLNVPPMPLLVGLHFLRYSGRLPPRSLIPLPFSWRDRSLLLSIRALRASRSTFSVVQSFLTKFSLRYSTLAWRVIIIPAAVNVLRGPQFLWVTIFLRTFILRHSTARSSQRWLLGCNAV
jgi:hypothetical protein